MKSFRKYFIKHRTMFLFPSPTTEDAPKPKPSPWNQAVLNRKWKAFRLLAEIQMEEWPWIWDHYLKNAKSNGQKEIAPVTIAGIEPIWLPEFIIIRFPMTTASSGIASKYYKAQLPSQKSERKKVVFWMNRFAFIFLILWKSINGSTKRSPCHFSLLISPPMCIIPSPSKQWKDAEKHWKS